MNGGGGLASLEICEQRSREILDRINKIDMILQD